jgi:hypothetical protein
VKKTLLWYILGLPLLVLVLLEIGLRILGYTPYNQNEFSLASEPEFWMIPDSNLGFGLNPGKYEVTVNEELFSPQPYVKDPP